MANSVTLRDVADLAGVSMGTASQALNNRPNVASETRARVVDAARTLGYISKSPIESHESNLKIIGLVTKHDLGEPLIVNPFYSYIQAGIESECREYGISLMYATVEVDESNHPVVWPAMIQEQHVEGLILAGTFIEETVDLFKRKMDVPIVLVDSYAPTLPFDSVVIDNTPAATTAMEYLITQGHTKIGLIGWNEKSPPSIRERKAGYQQALQRHGIQDMFIQPSGLVDRDDGYQALKHLLERYPQVTAVFACNDLAALGALSAVRDMGIRVPDDLSLMGFDNIAEAKEAVPPLTTTHVHKTWLGVIGVRQLIERAQTPDRPKVTVTVSTQFIARGSVGPPKA